ncbi:MAG: hypothetical protein WDN69_22525 [Aliidongia sp.]
MQRRAAYHAAACNVPVMDMKLRAKFNLAIFAAFIIGFVGAGFFLHDLFVEDARSQVLQNARIMMSAANAIRDYTTHEIEPVLGSEVNGRFLAISVPSFAAQPISSRSRPASRISSTRKRR